MQRIKRKLEMFVDYHINENYEHARFPNFIDEQVFIKKLKIYLIKSLIKWFVEIIEYGHRISDNEDDFCHTLQVPIMTDFLSERVSIDYQFPHELFNDVKNHTNDMKQILEDLLDNYVEEEYNDYDDVIIEQEPQEPQEPQVIMRINKKTKRLMDEFITNQIRFQYSHWGTFPNFISKTQFIEQLKIMLTDSLFHWLINITENTFQGNNMNDFFRMLFIPIGSIGTEEIGLPTFDTDEYDLPEELVNEFRNNYIENNNMLLRKYKKINDDMLSTVRSFTGL